MEHISQDSSQDSQKVHLPEHLPPLVEGLFDEHPPRTGRSGMTREQFLHEREMAPRRLAKKMVRQLLEDRQ
jgi:hypothetical protein